MFFYIVLSVEIHCNDGKCPLVRSGNANHSHDSLANFTNEEIDEKNPSSSEYSIFTIVIFILVPFSLIVYYPIQTHVSIANTAMFFSGILTASATIFAISFTVSHFLISRMADSYSPYVIKLYRDSQTGMASFFGLLVTTILSAIFLGVNFSSYSAVIFGIPYSGEEIAKLTVWFSFTFFMGSILIFSKHFILMMDVIDPIRFSFLIKKLALKRLSRGEFTEFNNIIISIGDIVTKSEDNGQTRVANHYVQQLDEIFNRGVTN